MAVYTDTALRQIIWALSVVISYKISFSSITKNIIQQCQSKLHGTKLIMQIIKPYIGDLSALLSKYFSMQECLHIRFNIKISLTMWGALMVALYPEIKPSIKGVFPHAKNHHSSNITNPSFSQSFQAIKSVRWRATFSSGIIVFKKVRTAKGRIFVFVLSGFSLNHIGIFKKTLWSPIYMKPNLWFSAQSGR